MAVPLLLLADGSLQCNLDSTNGESVMGLLRELHNGGATICVVTHDPRYARYADRTFHLFDGQVVEEDRSPKAEAELEQSGFKSIVRGKDLLANLKSDIPAQRVANRTSIPLRYECEKR
ncbi:MAG: hypothetical protein WKF84_09890 [Pyrinomonadaceae bacterium]